MAVRTGARRREGESERAAGLFVFALSFGCTTLPLPLCFKETCPNFLVTGGSTRGHLILFVD